jgi:hypothetical protein
MLPSGLMPWTQHVADRSLAGSHRIVFTSPGGKSVDVSYFRGIPTQLTSYGLDDPFGPSTAEISFPQVSAFDHLGGPGLRWLVGGANVDILWEDATSGERSVLWEGYATSLAYSSDENTSAVNVQCKGALFQVDNFEAFPEFPPVPIPYELMIKDGISPKLRPSLRTGPLKITFPDHWPIQVPKLADDPDYLKPYGVRQGQNWTGLTGRSTGSWNKMLTGQIQSLMSLMYTRDGSQWTLALNPGRRPELRVRPIKYEPDGQTLWLTVGQPGVTVNLTEDWSQAANVYYGQGTDISGVAYSNSTVSNDGSRTNYVPFASLRQVHPSSSKNRWFNPEMMRLETQVQFDNGLSPQQATALSLNQLQRSAHPGYTGNITLKVDPEQNGRTLSRFTIMPGMTVLLRGFKGMQAGLLVHVAKVNVSVNEASVDLTVDSKFRDLLTISQVRARARDALSTLRSLKVGSFSPVVNDLRKPWSYAAGSGVIPSNPDGKNAKELFMKYGNGDDRFPWLRLTRKYPPKKYGHHYITIPPHSDNFTENWSHIKDGYAMPCLFAEKGTIRLTQIAAYDDDGEVMPIRFHFSIYRVNGVNVTSMPMIPGKNMLGYQPWMDNHQRQRYPFYPGAFEEIDPNGAPKSGADFSKKDNSLLVGWGNHYQGAGYYPGLQSEGGEPTGLLLDESTWDFDTTSDQNFQQRPNGKFKEGPHAGLLFVMIYAESIHRNKPVHFLGRCFRQEPGIS